MKNQLLLILFLFVFSAHSQEYNQRVRPFTDYTDCFTGFVNAKGDTVWPQQFDKVFDIMQSYPYYGYNSSLGWIVKYGDVYGVIDQYGVNTIPFEFSSISVLDYYGQYFRVERGERVGVYSTNGELIHPLVYDEIYAPADQSYLSFNFHRNGYVGTANQRMEMVLPIEFDYIEMHRESFDFNVYDSLSYGRFDFIYYEVDKDSKYGIYDTTGQVLVPVQYKNPHFIYPMDYCHFTPSYFMVHRNKKAGIYDITKKKEAVPPIFDQVYYYFHRDNCTDELKEYAIGESRNNNWKKSYAQAFNLRTNKQSSELDVLLYFDDLFMFRNDNRYGILNADMDVILENYRDRIGYSSSDLSGEHYYLRAKDNVVITAEYEKAPKQMRKYYNDNFENVKKGLYNFKTGKRIDIKYDIVEPKYDDGKMYYWMYQFMDTTYHLDVYSEDFKLLNSLEFEEYEVIDKYCYDRDDYMVPKYAFQKSGEKYGMLDDDGSVLIPFEYNITRRLESRHCDTVRFVVEKNGNYGVFDEFGEVLVPANYNEITSYYHSRIVAEKDGKYDAYYNGKLMYEGMDHIAVYTYMDNSFTSRRSLTFSYEVDYTFYIVNEDTLYIDDGGVLVKADQNRFRFSANLASINSYLVNRKGKLILQGQYSTYFVDKKPVVYTATDTKFLDEDGNLIQSFNEFVSIRKWGKHYSIQTTNHIFGLLNGETYEWIAKLQYHQIEVLPEIDCYLVKEFRMSGQFEWRVINEQGITMTDIRFEYPFRFYDDQFAIFMSNGKRGLINKDLKIVLEPEYQSIYKHHGIYWAKKDNLWGAFRDGFPILEPQFDDVSIIIAQGNRLVFKDDRIGIISPHLEILLEPSTMEAINDSIDIATITGLSGKVLSYFGKYQSFIGTHITYRLSNNMDLIEISKNNTLEQLGPYVNGKMYYYPGITAGRSNERYRVTRKYLEKAFTNSRYHSYIEVKAFGDATYREYPSHTGEIGRITDLKRTTRNFECRDGELHSIELKDLFNENKPFEAKIDEILKDYINKSQLYGTNCVNLNGIIDEMKYNFRVGATGIYFNTSDYRRNPYLISYKELQDYLKHPEAFGL